MGLSIMIKTILKHFDLVKGSSECISSMPNFTGLGASSALTVGLVNAILEMKGDPKSKTEVAEWHISSKELSPEKLVDIKINIFPHLEGFRKFLLIEMVRFPVKVLI